MKLKVIVTGANSQLAQCIKSVSARYTNLDIYYFNSQELDITNQSNINKIFKNHNYDWCINCAAYTNVDQAEENKAQAFLTNAESVKYLAKFCYENKTTLIHISTDYVFNGESKKPYLEIGTTNPINSYGESKLLGESYIQDILDNYFIIRTSWLYSKYGNNFFKTMLTLSENKEELSIVNDQIGTPTYAEDLALIILNIIETESDAFGIYHYSNEGEGSWYDFAISIFQFKGIETKVSPIKSTAHPTRAKRPQFSVLDKTKMKQVFDLVIPHWEESLKKAILSLEEK
jgi:dTDP-4-dehydrorhamnose reductase